jgi:hypothetical protein
LFGFLSQEVLPAGIFQFLLHSLLLATEFRHSFPKLFKLYQPFLIGIQQLIDLQFGAFEALL